MLKVQSIKIGTLVEYPGNPRRGDVNIIAESLKVNGQFKPLVVQKSTMHVLAGNHTLQAAKQLEWTSLDCVLLDVDDEQAKRIVLADNRTSDVGSYDLPSLMELLQDFDLAGTGYTDEDLTSLHNDLLDSFDDDEEKPSREHDNYLLHSADLGAGEPETVVQSGDVFKLNDMHTLVVCEPHKEWELFVPYLTEGSLLCIFPDIYLTASDTAKTTPLVLVQPRPRLAAHMLDNHKAMFGDASVVLV